MLYRAIRLTARLSPHFSSFNWNKTRFPDANALIMLTLMLTLTGSALKNTHTRQALDASVCPKRLESLNISN